MNKLLIATLALLPMQAALAKPETYKIDPGHTTILWEAKHFATSTNRGRFDKKEGTVVLDREAKSGKIEISIDLASISSGSDAFNKHLSSADFFDVEKSPTATFTSDQLSFDGDKLTGAKGTLTLRGKSAPVELKAVGFNCYDSPWTKKQVCGGDFETTLKRSAWGMEYGLPGIPDEVFVRIQVEGGIQ